jgi:hypothetical protein
MNYNSRNKHMANTKKPELKENKLFKNIRNYVGIVVVLLVLMKFSKALFFISIFTIVAYQLKMIRGKFGLKMVVLDTLHFSAIAMAKYIGIKEAILFVFINTIIIDFLTFIASDGTFVNFFLYSASTAIAVFLFGNTPMLFYGCLAAIMYSIPYYIYRTFVVPNAPVEVVSKCITSILFTFLYITFFGPLMKILMTL